MNTPTIQARPSPRLWPDFARAHERSSPPHASTRESLGLPATGPLVMSGHQPQVWHAGVLAKYIAADRCARACDGHAAWLVVDHDEIDPGSLWYPAIGPEGIARRVDITLGKGAGTANSQRVMQPPCGEHPRPAPRFEDRFSHVLETLMHAGSRSRNAAEQVALAYEPLLRGITPPLPLVMASSLSTTPLFRALVDRMIARPDACIESYNAAAAGVPEARIRPLEQGELPLWRLDQGTRTSIRATDLPAIAHESLAPRALLMTAVVRMGLCDLFIHGTGGEIYDRVTDRWIQAWLGDDVRLAPCVMITATLLPDLPARQDSPERQLNMVRQRARSLLFDPSLVGDKAAAASKAALLAEIRRLPRHSPGRARAYAAMLELLAKVRADNAPTIGRLRTRAEDLVTKLSTDPASDRTLPFPLHAPGSLLALAGALDKAFESPG